MVPKQEAVEIPSPTSSAYVIAATSAAALTPHTPRPTPPPRPPPPVTLSCALTPALTSNFRRTRLQSPEECHVIVSVTPHYGVVWRKIGKDDGVMALEMVIKNLVLGEEQQRM